MSASMKTSDSAFLVLLFTFQFFVLIAVLISFINSVKSVEARENSSKRGSVFKLIIILFISKWLFNTYELVQKDVERGAGGFDPYKILEIENDLSFDTKKIKQVYRRLAKEYHPDKVDYTKISKKKATRRYQRILKAYQTLTKPVKFDNWIKYGDPDGSTAVKAIAIALPKWLFDEELRPIIYTGILLITTIILLSVAHIATSQSTTTGNGIMLESRKNMHQFINGVLQDNESNQRTQGFLYDDFIEMYETSTEVMKLNEQWDKKTEFRDIIGDMVDLNKENQSDEQGHMEKVLDLIPKLNEVFIEIVKELSSVRQQQGPVVNFEQLLRSMQRSTLLFDTFRKLNNEKRRTIVQKIHIDGSQNFELTDMITIDVKIERNLAVEKRKDHSMWIACINQTSGKTHIDSFEQNKDEVKKQFQTVLQDVGQQSFKILVFDGYGELAQSLQKQIEVKQPGQNQMFQNEQPHPGGLLEGNQFEPNQFHQGENIEGDDDFYNNQDDSEDSDSDGEPQIQEINE